MADINAIAEQIQGLTLLEASQLVKLLEEKLGVSAAAASVVAAPAGGGGAAAPAAEEKTEVTVVLTAAGTGADWCFGAGERGRPQGLFATSNGFCYDWITASAHSGMAVRNLSLG